MVDREFREQAMRRRIEQTQREREAQQRAEQIRQQKEAARRKPHCSAEGMTDLERRILARATRHQRILSEIRSGQPAAVSGPTALARWNKAVESCVAQCGGDKMRAVAMANQQNPGLRQAMLAEVNRGR